MAEGGDEPVQQIGSPCDEIDPSELFESYVGLEGEGNHVNDKGSGSDLDSECEDQVEFSSENDLSDGLPSLELENFQYGVTPPRNVRRQKERARKGKEKIHSTLRGQLKHESAHFAAGKAELDRQKKRGSTLLTTERALQRKMKRGCADTISFNVSMDSNVHFPDASKSLEIPSIKIESNSRFLSLDCVCEDDRENSSESFGVESHATNTGSVPVKRRNVGVHPKATRSESDARSYSARNYLDQHCPKDRIEFYRTFSILIKLGSPAHKQQESQKQPILSSSVDTQSTEENKKWKVELSQALWLELQAWHANRTMGEQDLYLMTSRASVEEVLDEVINFKVEESKDVTVVNSQSEIVTLDGSTEEDLSECNVFTKDTECAESQTANEQVPSSGSSEPSQLPNSSEPDLRPVKAQVHLDLKTNDTICTETDDTEGVQEFSSCFQLKAAIEQVTEIFDKVERVENLYPNRQSLGEQNPKYKREEFSRNFETMCLWLNVTRELYHKLYLIAKFVSVDMDDCETWKDWFEVGLGQLASSLSRPSRTSSNLSGVVPGPTMRYRPFVDHSIKKMGLIKLAKRVGGILDMTVKKARSALTPSQRFSLCVCEKCQCKDVSFKERKVSINYLETLLDEQNGEVTELVCSCHPHLTSCPGLGNFEDRIWSEEFEKMGLPSFRPLYMFLCRVPLDIIHESLRLRLQHRPKGEPSSLSVRQLLRECKDVLLGGVLVKDYYLDLVDGIADAEDLGKDNNESDIEGFEQDLQSLLLVYFEYLHNVIHLVQRLPQASKGQKNILEEEWNFVKKHCRHIRGGEVEGGTRFCVMASGLLQSTVDFLMSGLDQRKVLEACRGFKHLFNEARERASKALGFTKKLTNDLENAAKFSIDVPVCELLRRLEASGQGYLLIMSSCDVEGSRETPVSWTGKTVPVNPTVDTAIGLADIQVGGMILVVQNSKELDEQRTLFLESMSLCDACMSLRQGIDTAVERVDENLDLDSMFDMEEMEKAMVYQTYTETMHLCYSFGFEYQKEVARLVIGKRRNTLGNKMLAFAQQWMKFVMFKCERGRGTRPRWANQGLDFLTVACDPKMLAILSDAKYQQLTKQINDCICHVIGSAESCNGLNSPGFRCQSPACPSPVFGRSGTSSSGLSRAVSWPVGKLPKSQGETSNVDETHGTHRQLSDPVSRQQFQSLATDVKSIGLCFLIIRLKWQSVEHYRYYVAENSGEGESGKEIDEECDRHRDSFVEEPGTPWLEKVRHSLRKMETKRNDFLFEKHVIGRVSNRRRDIVKELASISNRKVPFKWQRGNKIGEGQFGKVYACANLDTGELMAVKQIKFQPNDHSEIKDLADEIKNFESIRHESLVKYYGVEVHRDEMFIFMEYCAEGTISDVSKNDLPEDMIRMYTNQILVAVSANIFLSSDGYIKLGDFGSSIKLKDRSRTFYGEINNMRGTVAYMAPEVITLDKGAGYGRAADIWSAGCVVVEMATGKPPWPECENNFTIMFKVGDGATPAIPETLMLLKAGCTFNTPRP
ncbi:Mitogen-activated protein kinase kinase kinase 4 [Acropora cervicornis]|uniref:Mitogen-activated protein kinase kinase kinase 4 n=1 Tax=Acropora cervicornis TaxID=6130 RepID=A0AAD9R0D2_ACRCE|nr:Mitogen-activated protein kinase kinase kinase 4 [Acropora cervicornis]